MAEWFQQKKYGYGAGLPIAWQGWAVLAGFIALIALAANMLADRPAALAAVVVPATAVLLVVTARTTRGGWRWRWGKRD